MSQHHSLTVVIPAYEETENLEILVPQVLLELKKLSLSTFQILVVMRLNEQPKSQLSGLNGVKEFEKLTSV